MYFELFVDIGIQAHQFVSRNHTLLVECLHKQARLEMDSSRQ